VLIRDRTDADDRPLRQLVAAAFDEPWVGELTAALWDRSDRRPGLVATEGTDLVGHVQLSSGWVDAAAALVDVLVLSPLAVRADRRRRGIGRALVAAAVARAAESGAPAVFLEGDPAYYSRLGWERGDDHGFTPPSNRVPAAAFQVVVLPTWRPWMTGALVYNDTFWRFDCVGLRPAATS
jgi:putative acetyltransferase